MKSSFAPVLLVMILSACTASSYIPVDPSRPLVRYDGEITILPSVPLSGYVRLGTVTGEGGLMHTQESLVAAIKRKAREIGADTLVLFGDAEVQWDRFLKDESIHVQKAILLRRESHALPHGVVPVSRTSFDGVDKTTHR